MAMLSTSDNPYNPFTQWDEWYAHDARAGHHTPSLLARLIIDTNDLSEGDQAWARDQVIDEIVERNLLGIYIKVEAP